MIDEFIKLFSGLKENFGKADMSKAEFDKERNKIKPHYVWAQEAVTSFHYKQHLDGKISIGINLAPKKAKHLLDVLMWMQKITKTLTYQFYSLI